MGHPLLVPKALPHGVSIYAGVAGEIIPALTTVHQNQPPSTLNNSMPLLPLPAQQTITRLTPEQQPPTIQWVHTTPDGMAATD